MVIPPNIPSALSLVQPIELSYAASDVPVLLKDRPCFLFTNMHNNHVGQFCFVGGKPYA